MNTDSTERLTATESTSRRHDHRLAQRSGWVGGAILIGLGILMMLQNLNLTSFYLDNWWALFILIPTVGAFGKAVSAYQAAGSRFTVEARSALFSGFILSVVTATFLFDLNWTLIGPGLLMLVGVSVLLGSMPAE